MFQASQLDQNGCANFLDIDTSYISDSGPEYENPLNDSAWKSKIIKEIGGKLQFFAEKGWNLLGSYQNIINWKKSTFDLQKYSPLSADSSKTNKIDHFVCVFAKFTK